MLAHWVHIGQSLSLLLGTPLGFSIGNADNTLLLLGVPPLSSKSWANHGLDGALPLAPVSVASPLHIAHSIQVDG